MKTLEMIKFGRTLTDREYGKRIAVSILKKDSFPLLLDFKGVISLGSSCGDEIVNAIALKQGNTIEVTNTNQAIRHCLEMVAQDAKITICFIETVVKCS